jgi:hypothetical protein
LQQAKEIQAWQPEMLQGQVTHVRAGAGVARLVRLERLTRSLIWLSVCATAAIAAAVILRGWQ